ncbi:helix-turn-helix transcriptional regulator [Paenibacillus sp. Marseille-Q4541]|uniref:helix-turn-helix transcriptional regulator n=1 Tax=Paenibacillus sp. Marseille-Q4541 TaxID=2831522 RepID=UPI0020199017|nr:helix-turn-helix transcriptional regulator [Paenibacillus sp. Marseille-Q4541]
MELSDRQTEIIRLVTDHTPITGEQIAEMLGLSRTTIRSDLSILVMLGLLDAKPKVGYTPGISSLATGTKQERIPTLLVQDIYTKPVLIEGDKTAYEAITLLFKENTGTLMIVNDQRDFIGIVSRKDLLRITLGHADLKSIPVSLVMTRRAQTITITVDESLMEAADKMMRYQVDCLPVLQRDGDKRMPQEDEVLGRITKTNLLNLFIKLKKGEL